MNNRKDQVKVKILFLLILLLPFIFAPFFIGNTTGDPEDSRNGAIVLRAILFFPLGYTVCDILALIVQNISQKDKGQ